MSPMIPQGNHPATPPRIKPCPLTALQQEFIKAIAEEFPQGSPTSFKDFARLPEANAQPWPQE